MVGESLFPRPGDRFNLIGFRRHIGHIPTLALK